MAGSGARKTVACPFPFLTVVVAAAGPVLDARDVVVLLR